jgi:CRISPR/Cas system-associated exonuclease Cas4 (RecB family)
MKRIQQTDVIEKLYNSYLKDQKYVKKEGHFSASSAGKCYREQYYIINNYEQTDFDDRVRRLLRLGTIVHKDFETAINDKKDQLETTTDLLTEYEIIIPELKIVGHLDIALVNHKEKRVDIYDLKTTGGYKWRLLFGRKPDPNPSFMYELQIGTYAIGLMNKYDNYNYTLSLIYYNKDTSAMKVVKKEATHWIDKALEYWTDLNETLDNIDNDKDLLPGGSMGTPMYDWQCRYCGFKEHCPGIFTPAR